MPTVLICTNRFESLAHITAENLGMPDLPIIVTEHPVGGLQPERLKTKAVNITDAILKLIT